MDGTSSPNHRVISPPAPALSHSSRVGKIRALFTSSSHHEQPELVQRRRSVRFQGVADHQLDGQPSQFSSDEETPKQTSRGSRESRRSSSSLSQRLSREMESLASKLHSTNGTDTIVHRKGLRQKPNVPYINTKNDKTPGREAAEHGNASPDTVSSSTPSPYNNANWSPASTASTGATSWASPRSSTPTKSRSRHTPEDQQHQSKNMSLGIDEGILPPIQEDSGRFLMIPVQEAPIETLPSVATVERAAAAKVYLETHFHNLLIEPHSPRSIRRKKFEHKMADLGLSHAERMSAREQWNQSESDHLRQMRLLKSSSVQRHRMKGVSMAGFDVIRILGKGSFGVVRLVTERSEAHQATPNGIVSDNGDVVSTHTTVHTAISNVDGTAKCNLPAGKPLSDVYAMKVIRKSEMLRACQEGHLRAERDFLVGAEGSRWVVPLIASFQDNTNLYLVMEYMIGGDFLGLLLREDVLDENVAR